MELSVKPQDPSLVSPGQGDPHPEDYFLSNLDLEDPSIVEVLFCFNPTPQSNRVNPPAQVIRDALKEVLAVYYPLAGRLSMCPQGRMYVRCTGEGAVFVEAYAECCLDDIRLGVANPDFTILKSLVYTPPTNILLRPPLVVQLTTFKCGGFVLGIASNHVLCDGLSLAEFLNSWAEIARGVPLSVPPFLDRTLLRARAPLSIEFPHIEQPKIENVSASKEMSECQYKCFPFSAEDVNKLKKLGMEDGTLSKCTTFQVVAAHVWKWRTKALRIPREQQVKLLVVMDVRRRLEPPLPGGYFGNAVYSNISICTAGELVERDLSFGVGLIQKAIEMASSRYLRSAIDYLEVNRVTLPEGSSFGNHVFIVTSWLRLPFHSVDFGWGVPAQVGPASPMDGVMFLPGGSGSENTVQVQIGLPPHSMMLFEGYARV